MNQQISDTQRLNYLLRHQLNIEFREDFDVMVRNRSEIDGLMGVVR